MRPTQSIHRHGMARRLPDAHVAARLKPTASGLARISLLLTVALLVALSLRQLATPAVVPATAPATVFSAARAMRDLEVIAREPRAVGSRGHAAARQYILDQIAALGLHAEVQRTIAVNRFPGTDSFAAGPVSNVVVRLPGIRSTGAVALSAHYDSGSTGPGASDCGACVAMLLETLRAVQAGPALMNDLIFVFADAEENRDQGAAAFNAEHRWAMDIRITLNYESQGSGGPALLYATSRDNGWLVSQFAAVAPRPTGSSLLPMLVRLLPGGQLACDLQEYLDRGSAGLGFVNFGDTPAYHTPRDNPDVVDPGSIQQEGDYTLALLRRFADLPLAPPPGTGDHIFFNVLPGVMVHYPVGWALPLAAVVTLAVLGVVAAGFRRGELTVRGLLAAALAYLVGAIASVAVVELLWWANRSLNNNYQAYMVGSYQTSLYLVAFSAACLAIIAALWTLLRGRLRLHNLHVGALLGGALLVWLASLGLPEISYLVLWPLLFGVLPSAWTFLAGRRANHPVWRVAILIVAVVPSIVLLPGTIHGIVALLNRFEGLMGLPLLGLAMLFVAPLIGLFGPHFELLSGRRRWVVPGVAALVCVALIAWGNITSGFDAAHPRPNRIAYELDAGTSAARWVSPDHDLDTWTGQFFPAGATPGTDGLWTAPAPVVALPAPEVAVIGDTRDGDVRRLTLHLGSPRGATDLDAVVRASGPIIAATIDGKPLELKDYAWARDGVLRLSYNGIELAGFELALVLRTADPISIAITDTSDGLPAIPGLVTRPRSSDMMPAPADWQDPTIVTRTFSY